MSTDDDWDELFGTDNDNDDDDDDNRMHENGEDDTQASIHQAILFLTQFFVKSDPQIPLTKRCVATTNNHWRQSLEQRSIRAVSDQPCDAAIQTKEITSDPEVLSSLRRFVVPGGVLLIESTSKSLADLVQHLDERVWNVKGSSIIHQKDVHLIVVPKYACPINEKSCPWKSNLQKTQSGDRLVDVELGLLQEATVARSVYEVSQQLPITDHSVNKAVQSIQRHGYCVVKNLLNPDKCLEWGDAIIQDFRQASKILLEQHQVDLCHPHDSSQDPQSYRELAMREDLRLDLRDGPQLRKHRRREKLACGFTHGDDQDRTPLVITDTETQSSPQSCLRFHPDVLRIVQKTMNPTDDLLCRGNFGRYNFDGGGPDGSPQPIRIGPVGGLLSLPGAADQAVHADTPHLYESIDCLPAHYMNVFAMACRDPKSISDSDGCFTGGTDLGGTAFVHGSHRLSFTSQFAERPGSLASQKDVLQNLVRPSLQPGDVVFFDCRILHFGLANNSPSLERPVLYANMMHAWFHDPKNWDDRQPIFGDEDFSSP